MPAWDSLSELERLRQEMDRVFQGAAGGLPRGLSFLPGAGARQYPRVNLAEAGENYVLEALAPGVDPATLDVTVKGDTLTISGEKKAPEGVKAEAFHRTERSAGRFARTVELPGEVDADKVKAAYVDGIIQVTLPKAEKTRPKRVEIAVG
jgi:HSP20 family protein